VPWIGELKVGSPLLFDVGVYFVVAGIVLSIAFAMMENQDAD
jgi:multicomponent Na+:H+ antiporter subunit B